MAEPLFVDYVAGLDVGELSGKNQILLIAYFMRTRGQTEFHAQEVQAEFVAGGLPAPQNLNIRLAQLAQGKTAPLMKMAKGLYSLSLYGVRDVQTYLQQRPSAPASAGLLESLAGRIPVKAEQTFLREAISCSRAGAKRAAVVLTWILAYDHLCGHIALHRLADFNLAISKRKGKSSPILNREDLADWKESDVIEAARSAGIVSKDVRKILDEWLGFRNTCAHPSDVEVPDGKVMVMAQDLVENVILKYAV